MTREENDKRERQIRCVRKMLVTLDQLLTRNTFDQAEKHYYGRKNEIVGGGNNSIFTGLRNAAFSGQPFYKFSDGQTEVAYDYLDERLVLVNPSKPDMEERLKRDGAMFVPLVELIKKSS